MLTTESMALAVARGRLRPSLWLRLSTDTPMLLPMDIMAMLATPMLTTESMALAMARGLLRPSPRLMAMATDPTDTDMPVPTPTVATAVEDTSTDKSSDHAST